MAGNTIAGINMILVKNRNYQILNIKHHTCLEYVLKKLIVSYGTTSFYFNNNIMLFINSISIKGFVYLIIFAKKNWDINFIFSTFPFFYFIATCLKMRT